VIFTKKIIRPLTQRKILIILKLELRGEEEIIFFFFYLSFSFSLPFLLKLKIDLIISDFFTRANSRPPLLAYQLINLFSHFWK